MSRAKAVVAIVDDDPRVIETLEDLLESAGYRAQCFSLAGPLLAFGFAHVDALITDIGVPDVDGFEIRRRALQARSSLPVFLITGRHELADRSQAEGITGVFRKPFDGQALLAALADALRSGDM